LHKTIIFISHDIQEALKLGDRIAVMKAGSIVQIGTPEELITQPKNDYIQAFLQEVNRAQILKVDLIIQEHTPLILDSDLIQICLQKISAKPCQFQYIVDADFKPVGVINSSNFLNVNNPNITTLKSFIQTPFPLVNISDSIETLFPLCQQDIPIAVIDQNNRFQGIVNPSDILSILGKLTSTSVLNN
jgi:glycine betaine/proline transport system ATP-binding protein